MVMEYFKPDSPEAKAAFDQEWAPVEARLKKLMPLKDIGGKIVDNDTPVTDIEFSLVADALHDKPDETKLIERFFAEVEKKSGDMGMTVHDLLMRPAGELTRWRKMGNRVTLLPNALVLHMNSK